MVSWLGDYKAMTAHRVFILLTAVLVGVFACSPRSSRTATSAAVNTAGTAPFKVGLTTLNFQDRARHRPLLTRVWYPADSGVTERDIALDGIFVGRAAVDGPMTPSPARFPLVLLSHGTGGGSSNLIWLAERLARHGFIAAAVDHFGNTFGNNSPEGVIAVWRRPADISRVLDALLADARFGGRIAPNRIGAAGFSAGGYTVIALAGAVYHPELMAEHCRSASRTPDCQLSGNVKVASLPDRDAASLSYRDPRIRAVFAMAPPVGPGFDAAGLAAVHVPVQIVAGANDELVPVASNAQHYASLIAGSRLEVLDAAGHFVFMPLCNEMGFQVARSVCSDINASVNRKHIHEHVAELAAAFFDEHLQ